MYGARLFAWKVEGSEGSWQELAKKLHCVLVELLGGAGGWGAKPGAAFVEGRKKSRRERHCLLRELRGEDATFQEGRAEEL